MTARSADPRVAPGTVGRVGTRHRESAADRAATVRLCAGAAGLGAAVYWLVRRALIDDSYITLSYARNVATDLHWGLIATEPANSATSPLNVMLLGGATALLRPVAGVRPLWGLAVVVIGLAVAMAWAWSRIAAELDAPLAVPAFGVAIVLANPFVLSAVGLEVLLVPAVLVGLLAASIRGRPGVFGVVAGLALLARIDLIVFVAPLALASVGVRRGLPRAISAAAVVALPWFVWSWWHFGSAIPDTFAIKTLQRSFGDWTYANGPRLYYERDGLATLVTFIPAVAGAAAGLAWVMVRAVRPRAVRPELLPAAVLGLAGAGYYGAYTLLGVPPYQWYYVPVFAAATICLVTLAGAALRGRSRALGLPGLALVACLVAASVVSDVRGGAPWRVPVIFGNWASPADYARVGRELGDRVGTATVEAPPEIGTLAYYCRCSIVDAFADRGRVSPLIEQRIDAAGPVAGALLRLNYWRLDRDQPPRPAQYRLIWTPGPATAPDQWQTWSPATGIAHLELVPIPAG